MKKKLKFKRVVTYKKEPDRSGMFISFGMALVIVVCEIINIKSPMDYYVDHFFSVMFGIAFFVLMSIFFEDMGEGKEIHYEGVR